MTREELAAFGVTDAVIDKILEQHETDIIFARQETETAFKTLQADIDFNKDIDTALTIAKTRNLTAAKALLDLDTLRSSTDLPTAIESAVFALRKQESYLFSPLTPAPPYAAGTGLTPVYTNNVNEDFVTGLNDRME